MDKNSEEYRMLKEAEYVRDMRTRQQRREYLQGVVDKRGAQAAAELERKVREIWK